MGLDFVFWDQYSLRNTFLVFKYDVRGLFIVLSNIYDVKLFYEDS